MLKHLFTRSAPILCPYCLHEIRGKAEGIKNCQNCKSEMPPMYVNSYNEVQPFFAQMIGWSQSGKTVWLQALTFMLMRMNPIWPGDYAPTPATDATLRFVRNVNESTEDGVMPEPTPLGEQEAYVMLLYNMARWSGRSLVVRDCAGELFTNLTIPKDQLPYLLDAPTVFSMLSIPDLRTNKRYTMDQLIIGYINTMIKNGFNFKKERRKMVVVLTKADLIEDLPANLKNYLTQDPIWAMVNVERKRRKQTEQEAAVFMQEYIERMEFVSDAIKDWIQEDTFGAALVAQAHRNNIDMRFSLISSTGSADAAASMVAIQPRRVLDPFFWALEFSSRQTRS